MLCNNLCFIISDTFDLFSELLKLLCRKGIQVFINLLKNTFNSFVQVLLQSSFCEFSLVFTSCNLIDAAVSTGTGLKIESVLKHRLELIELILSCRGIGNPRVVIGIGSLCRQDKVLWVDGVVTTGRM